MSSWKLLLKTWEFQLLNQVHLFTNSSFDVLTEISCVFNKKIVLIYLSDGPCIWIYVFHSLNVMNGDKITCLIIVRGCCGNFTPFSWGNFGDVNFRKILSRMVHFPFFSKIIDDKSIKTHLCTIQNNSFGLFLRSDKLINTNDSAKIQNITENDNIILEAIFLSDFGIYLIDIHFIIKFVTHFNQVVCTGFFIDHLPWVV